MTFKRSHVNARRAYKTAYVMWSIDRQFALGLESIVMPTTLHRKSVIEPDSPQYVHCVLDQFVCSILRFVWCALQCIVAMVLVMPQLLFVLFPFFLSSFIPTTNWNQSTNAVCVSAAFFFFLHHFGILECNSTARRAFNYAVDSVKKNRMLYV